MITDTVARLARWGRLAPAGLARVEFDSEFARQRVVQELRANFREAGIPFHEIELPARTPAAQIVRYLVKRFREIEAGVVSLTGFATAFPDDVPLVDSLRILNFNRENLALHPLRQIWWMPRSFADLFVQSVPDLDSWFIVRLSLTETVLPPSDTADFQRHLEQLLATSPREGETHWNVPAHNPVFTGREDVLAMVAEVLEREGRVAISGLSGMGKTQTAIEYAHRNRERYTSALWVRAESREALLASIGEIARELHLREVGEKDPARVLAGVRRWLDERTGWLLVLDNADDMGVVRDVLPSPSRGHVLLTTRAQSTAGVAPRIRLPEMDPTDGALLLLRRAERLASDAPLEQAAEGDRAAARTLSEEMDGLPLALDQAGAYIVATGIAPAEYLARYRAAGKLLRARPAGHGSHEHLPVSNTFSLAFEAILKEDSVDGEGSGGDGDQELITLAAKLAAADLLCLCAFLAPDAIPEEILTEGAPELGEYLGQAAADWNVYDAMMEQAIRYSLLERDPATETLAIHRVVQDVLKDEMDEATRRAWAERAVRAVNRAFPDPSDFSNWPECDRLLPHALACAQAVVNENLEFEAAARLLNRAGYFLVERGHYWQVEPLFQRALEICKRVLGPEHPDMLASQNNLALLYERQGRYAEAEPLFQQALEVSKRVLGAEHPDTLRSQNNLASLYFGQGRYDEAELLLRQVATAFEKVLGPRHPHLAVALENHAFVLQALGRADEAKAQEERAAAIRDAHARQEGVR